MPETNYRCVFPLNNIKDRYYPSYKLMKEFVTEQDNPCFVFSPSGKLVASYMKRKWITIH